MGFIWLSASRTRFNCTQVKHCASVLWFYVAGSVKKCRAVIINYQLIALIRQQRISVLQFSNDRVELRDLQLESPQVPLVRLLRNVGDRRRGGKQNLKKGEYMQVGGQTTEVDGEEELEGLDAILQHNHDKCMDCWWCSDMRDLGHIPIGLMFLYENKMSLKGIHMFYLHHKHVEKWVWKNVFLLDCWCHINNEFGNYAVIIAIPYNKTSHQRSLSNSVLHTF